MELIDTQGDIEKTLQKLNEQYRLFKDRRIYFENHEQAVLEEINNITNNKED